MIGLKNESVVPRGYFTNHVRNILDDGKRRTRSGRSVKKIRRSKKSRRSKKTRRSLKKNRSSLRRSKKHDGIDLSSAKKIVMDFMNENHIALKYTGILLAAVLAGFRLKTLWENYTDPGNNNFGDDEPTVIGFIDYVYRLDYSLKTLKSIIQILLNIEWNIYSYTTDAEFFTALFTGRKLSLLKTVLELWGEFNSEYKPDKNKPNPFNAKLDAFKEFLNKKLENLKKYGYHRRKNDNKSGDESDGGKRIDRFHELVETMDSLNISMKYLIPITGLMLSVYQLEVAWEEFNETYKKNDNIKWHREKEFMKFLKNYIPYKADKYVDNNLSHGFLY